MAKPQSKAPELTGLELWALAQVLHKRTLPPNLPLSELAFELIQGLSVISPEWRGQVLQDKAGPVLARQIANIPAGAPMPLKIMPATPRPTPAHQEQVLSPDMSRHLILADDLKNLPPPQYALHDYAIYLHSLNALVGPSGTGKSFVALDIAGKLATAGAKVIYIAGEGLYGYSQRWEVWKAHNNLTDCPNLIFYDEPINFMDDESMFHFATEISQHNPALVVVDTVARCMPGADENSTRDMGLFVASCDRIKNQLSSAILAIHHTGKDGKMRGSTALFGACDSVLFLQKSENHLSIYNSLDQGGKNKYSKEQDPVYKVFLPKVVTVDDKVFDSAVLVDGNLITVDREDKLNTSERQILEALEPFERGLQSSQIADATSLAKSTIYRQLKTLKQREWIDADGDRYFITEDGREAMLWKI